MFDIIVYAIVYDNSKIDSSFFVNRYVVNSFVICLKRFNIINMCLQNFQIEIVKRGCCC